MFTLAGFLEDQDQLGVYAPMTGLVDQHLNVVLDELTVPSLTLLVAVMAGLEDVAVAQGRLVSPTLRRASMFQVAPVNTATAGPVNVLNPPVVLDLRKTPLQLTEDEALEFHSNGNPAAVQVQWCLVWLSDKRITPVEGDIFTIRAASVTAAVAEAWTNVPIVLDEDLAPGRYQIVGMRGMSAGMIAARIVFRGGGWRPGVPGAILLQNHDHPMFRYGQFGVFGEFRHNAVPSIDVLSTLADAAQEFYFDLIKVG